MHQFNEQIDRIRTKLIVAKEKDQELKAFGASYHKYILHKPLEEKILLDFETRYKISLPACYRAFLLHLGNGGQSHAGAAAGPFYGIYPLGGCVDELTTEPATYLSEPVTIYPGMTANHWQELINDAEKDDITNEEYEAAIGNIYAGILPIGSQGCSYLHGLVLNGEHAGKVVNVDTDRQQPKFAFEDNFLDWYERWLDEIISGELLTDDPSWFGYTMGGTVTVLLDKYHTTTDQLTKYECIRAILAKRRLDPEIGALLEKEYLHADAAYKREWLQVLTKFNYPVAKPHLLTYSATDLLAVVQFVWWYAKDKSGDWLEVIASNLPRIKDDETFRFCTYLLVEAKMDYGPLIAPATNHENEKIRVTAFYTLGKLENKEDYLDTFINGLNDPVNYVIHAALQALSGVKDKKMLPAYKKILERFPTEQDYILSNLEHRLAEMGFTIRELKNWND